MRFTCTTSWPSPPKRGLTLIEVLAALAVLSTLLAGVLVAHGRIQRQWRRADVQLRAVAGTDSLIASWWQTGLIPAPASGPLPGHDPMHWRTALIDSAGAAQLGARVVRLHVYAPGTDPPATPLFTVDLLQALPPSAVLQPPRGSPIPQEPQAP